MWIGFRILIFAFIAFCISILFTMPLGLALNTLFFRVSVLKILFVSLAANLIFIASMIGARLIAPQLAHLIDYYMGIVGIGFGISVLFWIGYGILKIANKTNLVQTPVVQYGFVIVLALIAIVAIYNFEKPMAVTEFSIESDKVTKEYRFVHVADTQLGTTTVAHLNSVVDLIAAQNPDFVVFVGDLIDSDRYTLEDFAAFDKIDVPVYFERGNHEFYHDEQRLLDVVHKINSFKPLINDQAVFDEIQLTSVDFSNSKEFLPEQLKSLPVDAKKFSILLYHDPKPLGSVLDKGFDLMLAGHTHGGQIWPITWIVQLMYQYGTGYHIEGDTHIYTTSGAGLWGPRMRLGSQNEIAVFTLKPSKKS